MILSSNFILFFFLSSLVLFSTTSIFGLPSHFLSVFFVFLLVFQKNQKFDVKLLVALSSFYIYSIILLLNSLCYENIFYSLVIVTVISLFIIFFRTIVLTINIQSFFLIPKYCFFICLFFVILRILYLNEIFLFRSFTIDGIFNEPSHFAVAIAPILAVSRFYISKYNSTVIHLILWAFFISVSPSSTLIILFCFWLFLLSSFLEIDFILRVAFIFVVLLLLSIFYFFLFPYFEKVSGIFSYSENVTTLVYKQGYQDMLHYLFKSSGFGIGPGVMGCLPLPNVEARSLLYLIHGLNLNSNSGSFLLSKGVSELGYFFIIANLFVLFIIFKSYRSFKHYKLLNRKICDLYLLIFVFCSFYLISIFIRGEGYFMVSHLYVIFSIFLFFKIKALLSNAEFNNDNYFNI